MTSTWEGQRASSIQGREKAYQSVKQKDRLWHWANISEHVNAMPCAVDTVTDRDSTENKIIGKKYSPPITMKSIIFNNPKHSLIKYKIWYINLKFDFFSISFSPWISKRSSCGVHIRKWLLASPLSPLLNPPHLIWVTSNSLLPLLFSM